MSDLITILGAGVGGLVAATALSEAGARVRIIERGPAAGPQQCSWFAGGMLSPFCEQVHAEPAIPELGATALAWWQKHHAGTVRGGSLIVAAARDRSELDYFAARSRGHRRLDAAGIAELEPDLVERFSHGLFFPDEGHVDPRTALPDLARQLQERGVPIEWNTDAADLDLAGTVLDCRGLAARDRIEQLRGVRGEMLHIQSDEFCLHRPVRLLHPRGTVYAIPRHDGQLMIGGTMVESADGGPVTLRSAVELLNGAYALHPVLAEARVLEFGAGIRPALPDNLPRVWQQDGRWYLNGLFRHGFLLSPAMAEAAVAALVHSRSEAIK